MLRVAGILDIEELIAQDGRLLVLLGINGILQLLAQRRDAPFAINRTAGPSRSLAYVVSRSFMCTLDERPDLGLEGRVTLRTAQQTVLTELPVLHATVLTLKPRLGGHDTAALGNGVVGDELVDGWVGLRRDALILRTVGAQVLLNELAILDEGFMHGRFAAAPITLALHNNTSLAPHVFGCQKNTRLTGLQREIGPRGGWQPENAAIPGPPQAEGWCRRHCGWIPDQGGTP